MIFAIAWFELRRRLRLMSTWVYAALLFGASALLVAAAGGAFQSFTVGLGSDKVHANAPSAMHDIFFGIGHFALIITAGVFGQALHQDVENRCDSIVYTTPVAKHAYLGGRFLGALATSLLIFAFIGLGFFAMSQVGRPLLEASLFGEERASYYLWPYVVAVGPNVFICGALFFSLAALTRRMMPVYVGAVVLVMGYLVAGALLSEVDDRTLASMLDPFGSEAVDTVRQYWTTVERNSLTVPFSGVVLANRALWVGAGAALLAFTFRRFRMQYSGAVDARARSDDGAVAATMSPGPSGGAATATTPERGMAGVLARLTWLSFSETVKNTYFLVIVLAGAILLCTSAWNAGEMFDTPIWPVTATMIMVGYGSFVIFVLIIIAFYAGELVWRERDARMDQIFDALPVPTWLPIAAKLAALLLVQVVLAALVIVCCVVVQTIKGYHHYELGLYAKELIGLRVMQFAITCALAVFLHVIIDNKYAGHFAVIGFWIANIFLGRYLPHNLALFNHAPNAPYSDMNGYGHFLWGHLVFRAYWAAFAALLFVVAVAFWMRGTDTAARARLAEARRRFRGGLRMAAALAAATWIALGAYLFVNTNVRNRWMRPVQQEQEQADYEKRYQKWRDEPQPRVTDVKVDFDLDPARQTMHVTGTYTLTNKGASDIPVVALTVATHPPHERRALAVDGVGTPETADEPLGFLTFRLRKPLAPGASVPLTFDLLFADKGIANETSNTAVVENGTFFNSGSLPHIGYAEDAEIIEDKSREKMGLPPKQRLPDATDARARLHNYVSSDADWVSFDATVHTSPDQLAIAPGYLQRDWLENGKRHFHYAMDTPILHFFSVLSARYSVRKDAWASIPLEIYYHQGHEFNLDRMIEGMKDALTYCSTHYGPYQHRQLRIVEFPRYATFAQSFPNTIPFSEGLGFVARYDVDDEDQVDYPYYITAHEVAHQWWAHQVIGARVQGDTMLSETLAEYTALMVMKQKYGDHHMRPFLRQEADNYLRGRATERKREVPLVQVEDQPYIHYNKGGHVMYGLQDAIGEDNVARALATFLQKWQLKGPPYPTALDLLVELRAVTPAAERPLLVDLFETITLYDNHAAEAACAKTADGKYEISMSVSAKKLRAGELGDEQEIPLDRPVEIGALDDKGLPIAIEKRTLEAGMNAVRIVVAKAPAKVGVDPLVKLLDREPDDNIVAVRCPK